MVAAAAVVGSDPGVRTVTDSDYTTSSGSCVGPGLPQVELLWSGRPREALRGRDREVEVVVVVW